MNTIFFDSDIDDDLRRQRLYDGQLFVFSPRESTRALCQFAREMSQEAFAPHDPTEAQHQMDVERYVEILAALKPNFIHHPKSKQLIRDVLDDFGCDMQKTYFDVPRLRTVTSSGYLSSGLGYAFKPHRDTWYSAPMCQLNWWLPVFDIESENTFAFYPHYWNRPIKNSSHEFNYRHWVQTGRKNAAQHVKSDSRRQSEALEPLQLEPELRVVCPPGGLILFAAAHLHGTVPNTSGRTRLSIDFRTVHLDEIESRGGAPNLDSHCTGTTMQDYLRGADLEHISPELVAMYDSQPLVGSLTA